MKKLNVYNSSNTHLTMLLYGELIEIKPKESIQIETCVWLGDDNFKVVDSNPSHDWKESYTGRYDQNLILRQENDIPTFSCN